MSAWYAALLLSLIWVPSAPAGSAAGPPRPVATSAVATAPSTWRLTTGSGARLRESPYAGGKELARLPLGTELLQLDVQAGAGGEAWFKVRLGDGMEGWVAGAISTPLDPAARGPAFLRLAQERLLRKGQTFAEACDLVVFIDRVLPSVQDREVAVRLARLQVEALEATLAAFSTYAYEEPTPVEAAWLRQMGERLGLECDSNVTGVTDAYREALIARAAGTSQAEEVFWEQKRQESADMCGSVLRPNGTIATLGAYLGRFPEGPHAHAALFAIRDALRKAEGPWSFTIKDDLTALRSAVGQQRSPIAADVAAELAVMIPTHQAARVVIAQEASLVRSPPDSGGPGGEVGRLGVGDTVRVLEAWEHDFVEDERLAWIKVESGTHLTGWLWLADTLPFEDADPSRATVRYAWFLARQVVYGEPFTGGPPVLAGMLADLARRATTTTAAAEIELARLTVVAEAARKVNSGPTTAEGAALQDAFPGDVVWSDQWRVRDELYQALEARVTGTPTVEVVQAEQAATLMRTTLSVDQSAHLQTVLEAWERGYGRYLRNYPAGGAAGDAVYELYFGMAYWFAPEVDLDLVRRVRADLEGVHEPHADTVRLLLDRWLHPPAR